MKKPTVMLFLIVALTGAFASASMAQELPAARTGPSAATSKSRTAQGTKTGTVRIRTGTQVGTQTVPSGQAQQQNVPGAPAPAQGPVSPGFAGPGSTSSQAFSGQPPTRSQTAAPPRMSLGPPFSDLLGPRQSGTNSNTQGSRTFLNVPLGDGN